MTRQQMTRLCGVLGITGLALAVPACSEPMPSEMTIELPIVASNASHTGTVGRSFDLAMSQEVTATVTGDPDGVGTALITLNAGLRKVCWSLTAANILLPATASHIHRAPDGLSGPIVLGLTAPGANGTSSGCAENVDRHLIVEIMSTPADFYVNVHTTEHPPGAIRAQLN